MGELISNQFELIPKQTQYVKKVWVKIKAAFEQLIFEINSFSQTELLKMGKIDGD